MRCILNALHSSRRIAVNLAATGIVLTGVIFVGAPANADDSISQRTMSKRQTIVQMVGCMRKRMAASQSRSYNDAMKACKEQLNKESDNSPSGALVASDAAPKP
jgi:hypothetical protein